MTNHATHVISRETLRRFLAMDKFDRITFDPRIMGGRACTAGCGKMNQKLRMANGVLESTMKVKCPDHMISFVAYPNK